MTNCAQGSGSSPRNLVLACPPACIRAYRYLLLWLSVWRSVRKGMGATCAHKPDYMVGADGLEPPTFAV